MIYFPFKKKLRSKIKSFIKNILKEETSQKFASIEQQFFYIHNQFGALQEKLNSIEKKLDADILPVLNVHSNQTTELYKQLENVNNILNIHSEQATNLYKQLDNINNILNIHSGQFAELKTDFDNKAQLQRSIILHELKASLDRTRKALSENYAFSFYENEAATKKKRVIYTCITGNYDRLPLHEHVNSESYYVCFTDNTELLRLKRYGVWQIRPLQFSELDNTRNQRWHKTHPHVLFPEYEESIFQDANITMRSGWIFEEIEKRKSDLLIPIHFERDCIYDEIQAVIEAKKDDEIIVKQMENYLKEDNFPFHYGLNETNLIYRRHNEPKIKDINENWWNFIRNYSKRDQLSLSYVLYKHKITPSDIAIPNLRNRYRDFLFINHLPTFCKKVSLPNYQFVSDEEIKFNIDFHVASISHSQILGWAYVPRHDCRILIGTTSAIFNCDANTGNMTFALIPKIAPNNEVLLPDIIERNDVKDLFGLETNKVGFKVETNTLLKSFVIYLVDDKEMKIYSKLYNNLAI